MRDDRLERALEECLRALRRGVSVETCLAGYGDLRLQLRPLLATAAQVWSEPAGALPEGRHTALRGELLSAIAAEPHPRQPFLLPVPAWPPLRRPASPSPSTERGTEGVRLRRPSMRPLAFASVALAAVVAVLMLASTVMLRGSTGTEAATTVLTILQGEVRVETRDGVRPGVNGMRIQPGETVITAPGGRAVLTFFDGSTVTLDSDTVVLIQSLRQKDGRLEAHLTQARGSTWTHVPTQLDTARIEIDTPTARVQTRDASFATTVQDGGGTRVGSQSGGLEVTSGNQTTAVQGGQQTAVDSPGVVVPASSANPPDKELVLRIRGPVYAVLTDPSGATIGLLDPGVPVNQVSGATATREGDTLVVRIPNPDDGRYALGLRSAGDGQVTVVAEVHNGGTDSVTTSLAVSSGETLTSGLQLTGDELALGEVSRSNDDLRPAPVTVPDLAIEKAKNNIVPPTSPTPVPATSTPTRTPVPPTATPVPTSTPAPPTKTPIPTKPTATPTQRPRLDPKPIEPVDTLDVTSDAVSVSAPSTSNLSAPGGGSGLREDSK